MKSLKAVIGCAVAGLLLTASPGFAQVSEDGMGKVLPVELYACNFKQGKDDGDLSKVIDRWNKFSDENGMDNYAAWLLRPFFYTSAQEFDILWLGAYSDGNAMGTGLQNWISNGRELNAAFEEVIDCGAHVAFSSAMYKAPPGGGAPGAGVISIMDCELNEGYRYSDVKAAELKWMEHLGKSGSKAAYYHWMPMFGGGDADFDYKVVSAYASFEEVGSDIENFANEGGRDVSRDIFARIDDCDDARVYLVESIRSARIRD